MSGAKAGSLWRSFAAIGPGIVVAGSVIGSGELINTPVQAAKFGFVLLWVVMLSCVIKYFLQVEIARHCLVHNRTTVQALNICPGPRVRGTSWTALLYMFGYFATMLTVVGIIGALGGLISRIEEHPLVTRILAWPRRLAALDALLPFVAAGSLVVGPSGDARQALWTGLAAAGVAIATVFTVAFIRPARSADGAGPGSTQAALPRTCTRWTPAARLRTSKSSPSVPGANVTRSSIAGSSGTASHSTNATSRSSTTRPGTVAGATASKARRASSR